MASGLTSVEEELSRTKARLTELQVKNNSLESAYQEVKRENHEQVYKFKARYTEQYQESKKKWRAARIQAHREGYIFGARDQRLEFFLSPHGHQFLKVLFEGTLQAYHKTPDFMRQFAPVMAHLITEIGRKAVVQVGGTPEQVAKLDLRALMYSIDNNTLYGKLGIDAKAPDSPAWWYPALDRAIQQFTVGLCTEPAPDQPLFASPFIEVLREFVQGLARSDAAPRSFAEFGLYPPQPLSLELMSPLPSREGLLDRLNALYKDEVYFARSMVKDMSKDVDPFPDVDATDGLSMFDEAPFSDIPSSSAGVASQVVPRSDGADKAALE